MRAKLVIILALAILMLIGIAHGMLFSSWGGMTQSQGSHQNSSNVIGNYFILGGRALACISVYVCTNYTACNADNRRTCTAVMDIGCGDVFTGDFYETTCEGEGEGDTMYLLIFIPLMFGLFALVGAATMGKEHSAMRISLFLLSFLSVIGAAYLGSSIVGTTNAGVQSTLGVTTNYLTWIFIAVVLYFLIFLIYTIFNTIGRNKQEKLNY